MVAVADSIDISCHDRYLIYLMLGRYISVSHRPRKRRNDREGVAEDVRRNIFDGTVELVIDGILWSVKEPPLIISKNGSTFGSVVFVYGDFESEITDDQLFEEMASPEDFGETVDDALARTRHQDVSVIEFLLGDKVKHRGKTWRKSS